MLTITRRDKRTRRQASFTLESLDSRLVLSAAAAGAAAGAVVTPHEAKLARVEARHEAKLARIEARHEARLAAFAAAHPASPIAIEIGGGTSTSTSATAATSAATSASSATPTPVTSATSVSGGTVTPNEATPALPAPTTTGQAATGALPANVAAPLQSLYTEYEAAGSGTFTPSQPTDGLLQISGDSVEVSINVASGSAFDTALSQLETDGMQVTASSSTYNVIQGMLPISELPAAAQLPSSVNPISAPSLG
jgi:hypothetical protein